MSGESTEIQNGSNLEVFQTRWDSSTIHQRIQASMYTTPTNSNSIIFFANPPSYKIKSKLEELQEWKRILWGEAINKIK